MAGDNVAPRQRSTGSNFAAHGLAEFRGEPRVEESKTRPVNIAECQFFSGLLALAASISVE
jgi:hypothetical protein